MSSASANHGSDAVGHLKTDRAVVWTAVVMTGLLIAIRLWIQLADRISQAGWIRARTSDLGDPALAQLAVRLGIVLAIVLSTLFQGLYLFLCAVVDEKILPVQLAALIADVSAPKEYPAAFVWLFVVVVVAVAWTWRRPAMNRAGIRGKVISTALLLVISAISLVL